MSHLRLVLPLAILGVSCTGSGDGTAGDRASAPLEPTVRDSAGITIYEHPPDALTRAPLLTLDSTPLAIFAGDVDDPEKDVSALTWPLFLGSGDLISYDRQAKQILLLKTTTRARTRHGRAGSGPGEIGFPGRFVLVDGDSVLFTDSRNDRVVIVHPDSGIVREFSRNTAFDLRRSGMIGRIAGDSLYLLFVPGSEPQGPRAVGRVNTPQHLGTWRVGQDSVYDRFSVPSGWLVWQSMGEGSMAAYGLPFAPHTSIGKWGNGFLVARGEGWSLEQWDTAGILRAQLRINAPSTPIDDAMFDRYIQTDVDEMAQNIQSSGRAFDRNSITTSVRARGHADSLAPYGPVFVSANGTMWVTDFVMPGDSGWAATAVAPDGRILGRLSAANGEPPIAWGDDRIAIKTEDDLGIATITILKVRGL